MKKRWLPRIHFSLRTLLLLVLMIASGATLWWNWGPWEMAFRFEAPEAIDSVSFSDDDQFVLCTFTGRIGDNTSNSLDVRDANSGRLLHHLDDLRFGGTTDFAGDYAFLNPIAPIKDGFGQEMTPVIFNFKTGEQLKFDAALFKRGDRPAKWQISSHFILLNYETGDSLLVRLPGFEQIAKLPRTAQLMDHDRYVLRTKTNLSIHDLNTGKTFTTQDCDLEYESSVVNLHYLCWLTSTTLVYQQWIENPPAISGNKPIPFVEPHEWTTIYVFEIKNGALILQKDGGVSDVSQDGKRLLLNSGKVIQGFNLDTYIFINLPAKKETKFESTIMKLFSAGTLLFDERNRVMLDGETLEKKWERPGTENFALGISDNLISVYKFPNTAENSNDEILDARTGQSVAKFSEQRWKGLKSRASEINFSHSGNAFAIFENGAGRNGDMEISEKCSTVFRLRRPISWYGPAYLPEFWLTIVLSAGLIWSFLRDRKNA